MGKGQKAKGESKYAHLLEDPAYRAWFTNVARGSQNTAAHYFLHMGFLCDEMYHITPARMAAMNRVELMTFLSNAISDLEERGVTGTTITSYIKSVKSWMRFNGKRIDEKVNVPESESAYGDELVPKPADVQTLLHHSDLRGKVGAALMAFSGLRPESLGDCGRARLVSFQTSWTSGGKRRGTQPPGAKVRKREDESGHLQSSKRPPGLSKAVPPTLRFPPARVSP